MRLKIVPRDHVAVPLAVTTSGLTLAQIGALVTFSAYQELCQSPEPDPKAIEQLNWIMGTDVFALEMKAMKEKGILKTTKAVGSDGKTLFVQVDQLGGCQ